VKCGTCPKKIRFGLFYVDAEGKTHYACLPCARTLGPKLTGDMIADGLRRVADRLGSSIAGPV
jgi:hypothetical protein